MQPISLAQVPGAFLIFTLVPIVGALPLIGWIVRLFTGKQLKRLGTGNVSVSAAFYHGGTFVGVLCVVVEALKGIFAVLLARYFFGDDGVWPVLSLIFLVMGRYWGSQGAGTTNIAWGFFAYDPLVAGLTLLISAVGFTLLRMKQQGKLFVLVLMPVLTALCHPTDGARVLMVACLSGAVGWIYHKIPDDLEMSAAGSSSGESRRVFRFFQGDRALPTLSDRLDPNKVGTKAATLSRLHAWGYPVAPGYVLAAGDDPSMLIATVFPNANLKPRQTGPSQTGPRQTGPRRGNSNPTSKENNRALKKARQSKDGSKGGITNDITVVARSSAIGEDTLTASAAGQYVSVTEITSPEALEQAITICLNAYSAPSAVRYRADRGIPDGAMNVLVQPHIFGVFSGVAFSRDPITHIGDAVVIEALPGDASQVVSGQITPERYQVSIDKLPDDSGWQMPADMQFPVKGIGQAPKALIAQVAYLARHIENKFHGVPQDIEWTFDGEQLWVLQSRPITTLLPIWTRKIAAEVIPGVIRPLTWSINQPLTCGVWGNLFTTVLKKDRVSDLDFRQTATLHYGRAYFNATLLGDIFTRMGLPPDSLEFLTRGAKFQRPPLLATLRNVPGLLRLWRQENSLPSQFAKANQDRFKPALVQWEQQPVADLSQTEIAKRIETILTLLEEATYFNIMSPLSLALRQAIWKVDLATLDSSQNPEVRALEDLKQMAVQLRSAFGGFEGALPSRLSELGTDAPQSPTPNRSAALFAALADHPEGHHVFDQLDRFLAQYGYLSEVATDIAVPTWRESPQPVRELLTQFLLDSDTASAKPASSEVARAKTTGSVDWKTKQIQTRLNLKGQVAEAYDRLFATLRACFVELESRWLSAALLEAQGDIFFLGWSDIKQQLIRPVPDSELRLKIHVNKAQWHRQSKQRVPYLIYGQPTALDISQPVTAPALTAGTLQGIGASAGKVEGTVQVLESVADAMTDINEQTILVVPYTDAGWSPLLARIGGLIAEVGGQLSHGAIVAREYGIPAVMDVTDATHRLQTGQRVRIDGQHGTIEIL